jgi:hypothetical protein
MLTCVPVAEKFLEWFRQDCSASHKLLLADFPQSGRGLMATADIAVRFLNHRFRMFMRL